MGKNKESELDQELDKIYYSTSDPGSYGGARKLLLAAKSRGLRVSQKRIQEYLRRQQTYTLHKPARKNFARNPTVVGGIDHQWQADLADMQSLSKYNKGNKYLLTVIDIFSKYAWAIPIKNKGSKEMANAFKTLFDMSYPRQPLKLQTDAGKEFLNKDVQSFLKFKGIVHFVSNSDQKAAVVERFNRTLKSKIWTYFTAIQTYNYLDKLDDFLKSYNNSYHRSIKMKPIEVTSKNEDNIWANLYLGNNRKQKSSIKEGNLVRISKVKGVFEKGYIPNWSAEHFHVKKEIRKGKPVYHLVDDMGEDIKGEFYEEELQPIEGNRYLIEKILGKRKSQDGIEYFVKWKGWPSKFNSWVKEEDFEYISK